MSMFHLLISTLVIVPAMIRSQQFRMFCNFDAGDYCNFANVDSDTNGEGLKWETGETVKYDAWHSIPRTLTGSGNFAYAQGNPESTGPNRRAILKSPEVTEPQARVTVRFDYWKTAWPPVLQTCIEQDDGSNRRCFDQITGPGPQSWTSRVVAIPPQDQNYQVVIVASELHTPYDLVGIDNIEIQALSAGNQIDADFEYKGLRPPPRPPSNYGGQLLAPAITFRPPLRPPGSVPQPPAISSDVGDSVTPTTTTDKTTIQHENKHKRLHNTNDTNGDAHLALTPPPSVTPILPSFPLPIFPTIVMSATQFQPLRQIAIVAAAQRNDTSGTNDYDDTVRITAEKTAVNFIKSAGAANRNEHHEKQPVRFTVPRRISISPMTRKLDKVEAAPWITGSRRPEANENESGYTRDPSELVWNGSTNRWLFDGRFRSKTGKKRQLEAPSYKEQPAERHHYYYDSDLSKTDKRALSEDNLSEETKEKTEDDKVIAGLLEMFVNEIFKSF